MPQPSRWRRPAQHFPLFPHLAVVPALLAVATAVALFVHSDVNAALLWSQCHSHALLPALSRVPILGTPTCYLVSFFYAALDSFRSKAVMSVILSYVGALLTVSTVESARKVNEKNAVVARPTLPWLVFNLLGGALVWQLVYAPAFILGAKAWPLPSTGRLITDEGHGDQHATRDSEERDPLQVDKGRQMKLVETIAIPIAVALGYYVPSTLMLSLNNPVAIGTWLFFPAYVSLIRQFVRYGLNKLRRFQDGPMIHMEANTKAFIAVYAVPILCSLLAHGFIIGNLTKPDDRQEVTRSTVKFIEIDSQFIGLTMLYWVFTEVGWRAPLAMVIASIVLGPGAGTALGWLYREKLITSDLIAQLLEQVNDEERGDVGEETPLIQ
ncbi:hypothetical protein J3458_019643 [Metarhizium acridum]|uniref:Corticosteroid-binding protein n=1 Tax=Metarhizium acridum (strain CQMa 102) TaxID=655827 RepID=E9DV11_METAQ|nr:uncharacterized protein MAC_01401 [Metarhizium acridum CQMa 102]EFY92435.1 hypothetical protein MAC_01401 [Metarhizium acridum CQMa 102]KAG8408618.1 hypothetical protein J3458_019643 [Metarhizium acridum]